MIKAKSSAPATFISRHSSISKQQVSAEVHGGAGIQQILHEREPAGGLTYAVPGAGHP